MTAAALRLPRLAGSGRRVLAGVVLVLVAVAAAVLGGFVARALSTPRPPARVAALPVLRTVPVDVLDRPQTAVDRLDAPRGGDFIPTSVRRLAVMPSVPSVLSVARDASGDLCLLTAVEQGRQYSAACVTPAEFARRGITLQWSLSGWSAGEPFVEQGYLPRFFVVVWGPDGRIRYQTHVVGEG